MIVLLSPSKDMASPTGQAPVTGTWTLPLYLDKSERLMNELRKFSIEEIADRMMVNNKLAIQNYLRFQQWSKDHTPGNSTCSIMGYTGEAYRGLRATRFSAEELTWSQEVLRILSGLYGMLRPLDLVQPYRLELGSDLPFRGIKSLYDYWGSEVTDSLNKAIEDSPGEKVLVNLASVEYSSVIDFKRLKFPVITPAFKEGRSGSLKMITVYTKKARGLMTRFIIENQLENPEDLKAFTDEGYYFENQLSKGDNWLFVR